MALHSFMPVGHDLQIGYSVRAGCQRMGQRFPESSLLILKYDFEAVTYYKE